MQDEPYVAQDQDGRWYVTICVDRCDADGNWGADFPVLGDANGYPTREAAAAVLAGMMNKRRGRAMTRPTATKLDDQGCQATWAIHFPGSMFKGGASYRAVVHPGSQIISLETWNTRRPVAAGVARRRMPLVRQALAKAGAI